MSNLKARKIKEVKVMEFLVLDNCLNFSASGPCGCDDPSQHGGYPCFMVS